MSGPDATLRPALRADVDVMAETIAEAFDSYREFAPAGWQPPDTTDARKRMRTALSRPSVHGTIALVAGAYAGHLIWLPASESHQFADPDPGLAHIWQLFLPNTRQGEGIATTLLDAAVAEAAAAGFERMRLFTPEGQARARRFYEREGWDRSQRIDPGPDLKLALLEYVRPLPSPGVQNA